MDVQFLRETSRVRGSLPPKFLQEAVQGAKISRVVRHQVQGFPSNLLSRILSHIVLHEAVKGNPRSDIESSQRNMTPSWSKESLQSLRRTSLSWTFLSPYAQILSMDHLHQSTLTAVVLDLVHK